jgi:hypothetical protein
MSTNRLRRALPLTLSLALAGLAATSTALAQQRLGDEFQINSYTPRDQLRPAVASDPQGNFVVVWEGHGDGNYLGIFGQRFDASGNPLGEEFQVNTYTFERQWRSSVASAADGRFVVIWEFESFDGVLGQRFDAEGNPLGGEFEVNSSAGAAGRAAVASDADGDFLVVWRGEDEDQAGILGRRFDNSGNPLGEEFQVNSYWTGHQDEPDVSADPDGNSVVVWSSDDLGSIDSIFGQRFDADGSPLAEEFRVSRNPMIEEYGARVSFAADGSFVVVWRGEDILGQRFDAAGYPVAGEFRVNTYTSGTQWRPDVSADSEGGFIVVWNHRLRRTEDDDEVFGQAFAPDGTPLGGEFQINSYTTDEQAHPAVASDAKGNFVVAWSSEDQDGDFAGIFGQRFAGPGLALTVDGTCPGPVTVDISSAPPASEVALIAAANTNGFVKGGTLCNGTQFEIGEPFQLPPSFVIVDGSGNGSTNLSLQANRCHLQALAFATCETSNVVEVP